MDYLGKNRMPVCLIVDDDKISLEIAEMIVSSLGIHTETKGCAEKAIEFCSIRMPEIIILDFMMPGANGDEFLKKLHKKMGGHKPYIIACTALNDLKTVKIMQEQDVDDYIVKPFEPELLKQKIKNSGTI